MTLVFTLYRHARTARGSGNGLLRYDPNFGPVAPPAAIKLPDTRVFQIHEILDVPSAPPISSIRCLSDRPLQPVEPPDCQHVARSQRIVLTLEAGALHLAATDRVLDDLLAPCLLQGVTLQVKILLRCRNSRIADDHTSPPLPLELGNPSECLGAGFWRSSRQVTGAIKKASV